MTEKNGYRLPPWGDVDKDSDALVHLRLFLVAVIWGAAWTSGRHVATNIPPITGAMLRYAIAVPFFLLILLQYRFMMLQL